MTERLKPCGKSRSNAHLAAAALGALPLYCIPIVMHLTSGQPLSTPQFVHYLAVISPLSIVLVLALLRVSCGEDLRDLNLKSGTLSGDLRSAALLAVCIVVANVISHRILAELLTDSDPDGSVPALFAEFTATPERFVLFLGLLVPLGAAAEEIGRTFLLSRLWKIWPTLAGKVVAVGLSATLFGLMHAYQGPRAVAWSAIYGLITASYYLRSGRIVPLVLAHYLTNALYVVIHALAAR